jgi:chaperone required for assembly of F1-ATPase
VAGFQIALDGRTLQTPAAAEFRLSNRALAEAIAEEWRAQADRLKPSSMPLTQLAYSWLDQLASDPTQIIDELMRYAETDLVCYRADGPGSLVKHQQRNWQPLLDDLARRHDILMSVHRGVLPRKQSQEALAALRRLLSTQRPFTLAAMAVATRACGSLVIALALCEGSLTPEQAFDLSQLDETYQIERWGEDAEAAARRCSLRQEIIDVGRFLSLAR